MPDKVSGIFRTCAKNYPIIFPPLAEQFDLLVLIQPLPLQPFCPAQALLAVAHALVPLHELIPEHFTSAIFAAGFAVSAAL